MTETPFNFLTLVSFQKAELLIHWLRAIINATGFSLHKLALNQTPFDYDTILNDFRLVMLPHAITNNNRAVGTPMFHLMMKYIARWRDRTEFERIMRFRLDSFVDSDLVDSDVMVICFAQDIEGFLKAEQIGCRNFKIYFDLCRKHKSLSMNKEVGSDGWSMHYQPNAPHTVIRKIFNKMIYCVKNDDYRKMIRWWEFKDDMYYKEIYGMIGRFFRNNWPEKVINYYLERLKEELCIENKTITARYYDVFCHFFRLN